MINMLEESALDYNIVLQWRINKTASWVSLKSSEINNYSWTISEALEYPFYSSSCCQTCFLSIVRRMNTLWELNLKIFLHSPELCRSVFFSMHLLWMTNSEKYYFPGSMSIQLLVSMGTILGEESAFFLLCDFAFAFDRHAKAFALNFIAYSSSWSSGTSVSLLFKFITNWFDPWEILTQEWVLSLFKEKILTSTPYLSCKKLVAMQLPIRDQCWCFLGSSLSVVILLLLLEECIHDRSLCLIVRDLQCLSSWSAVHSHQHSEILYPYRIFSICLVVTTSQSILHIVAIENLCTLGHHYRTENEWGTWLSHHNKSPRSLVKGVIISLRLFRKDWTGLQKRFSEKKVSIVSWSAA